MLINSPTCWTLKREEDWHGFKDEDIAEDYCMLDPTKVTILMPGINSRGELADWGIPGAILTEFLDARLVEIARTGDYTALILFSVGASKRQNGVVCWKRCSSSSVATDNEERYTKHCPTWSQSTRFVTVT